MSIIFLNGQQEEPRSFDQELMDDYAEQRDFDYMDYSVQPPSVWERLSWWFSSIIQRIFLNPNTPILTQIGYYLILLLVLGFAVFYIIKLRYGGGLTTDYRTYRSSGASLEKTVPEDFDEMIREALEQNDFKLAIRYVYLKTLTNLAKKDHLKLRDWKSPFDYERELQASLVGSYREMAQLFEYAWYGDFEVGEEEYNRGLDLSKKLE